MKRWLMTALGLAAFTSLAAAPACGGGEGGSGGGTGANGGGTSDGGTSCNDDPLVCPSGQTCWFTDTEGAMLDCYKSGAGKAGDPCDNFVKMPSCGDGMICLQLQGMSQGACAPYCDASHPCPNNTSCLTVMTPGMVTIHACDVSAPPQDGGADGG